MAILDLHQTLDDVSPSDPHIRAHRRRWLRALEASFFTISLFCSGYVIYVTVESYLYQRFEDRELNRLLSSNTAHVTQPPAAVSQAPEPGSPLGRIEIDRLGVSAIVLSGSDATTLRRGVGHIPGTALPGVTGNIGLAAHRDTFFRRLRYIEPGDEVRITSPSGTSRYRVESTRIVDPSDTWVLDHTASPTLTLVTCYPFTFIGSAPRRFIVRAVEIG